MTVLAFDHPSLNAHAITAGSPVAIALIAAGTMLAVWETRHRTRAALRRLSQEFHADIGMTADQVLSETAKPFWRA